MSSPASVYTRSAEEIVQSYPVQQSPNGICYAAAGETAIPPSDLERMVSAVPITVAKALQRKAYYFVPLTIHEADKTVIADRYDVALSDRAVCHRNLTLGSSQYVFISTRLMDDKFSVAFEFYINVGHAFVEQAGLSQEFADVVWRQAERSARGETSMDAHDFRRQALIRGENNQAGRVDEKAKFEYLKTTFADSIAIYMLSLNMDVDYYDLREREYPLLMPSALAERLRKIAELFPPNPGFDFAIYYRRRPA
jgi:hypothetical protein